MLNKSFYYFNAILKRLITSTRLEEVINNIQELKCGQ